jgi:hypothetical protein
MAICNARLFAEGEIRDEGIWAHKGDALAGCGMDNGDAGVQLVRHLGLHPWTERSWQGAQQEAQGDQK